MEDNMLHIINLMAADVRPDSSRHQVISTCDYNIHLTLLILLFSQTYCATVPALRSHSMMCLSLEQL